MRKLLLSLLILLQIFCFTGCDFEYRPDTKFYAEDYAEVASAEIIYSEWGVPFILIKALDEGETKQLIQEMTQLDFYRSRRENDVRGNSIKLIFPDGSFTVFSPYGQKSFDSNGKTLYRYDEDGERTSDPDPFIGTPKDKEAFIRLVAKYMAN